MLEIDEGLSAPDFACKILAGDDLTGALDQDGENLGGLGLQLKRDTVATEFACAKVKFEVGEACNFREVMRQDHWFPGERELGAIIPLTCKPNRFLSLGSS